MLYENGINDIPLGVAEDMSSLYNVPFDELRKAAKETKEMIGANPLGRIRTKRSVRCGDIPFRAWRLEVLH